MPLTTVIGKNRVGQCGLALVHMAALLLVAGLLVATLLPLLVSTVQRDVQKELKARVRAARDEAIGYVVQHCTIPPASWTPGHRQGKTSLDRVVYIPHAGLLSPTPVEMKPNPNQGYSLTLDGAPLSPPDAVAFFVVGQGANRATDLNTTLAPVNVPRSGASGFDDVVEYATTGYLAGLNLQSCTAGSGQSSYVIAGAGRTQPSLGWAQLLGNPAAIAPSAYKGLRYNGLFVNANTRVVLNAGGASAHDGGNAARFGQNDATAWEQAMLLKIPFPSGYLTWTSGVAKHFSCQYSKAANTMVWSVDGQTQTLALNPPPEGYTRVAGNFFILNYVGRGNEEVDIDNIKVNGALVPEAYRRLHTDSRGVDNYQYLLSQRDSTAETLAVEADMTLVYSGAASTHALDFGTSAHIVLYDISPIVMTGVTPASGPVGTLVALVGQNFPTTEAAVYFYDVANNLLQSATIVSNSATLMICRAPAFAAGSRVVVYVKGRQSYAYSNALVFAYE